MPSGPPAFATRWWSSRGPAGSRRWCWRPAPPSSRSLANLPMRPARPRSTIRSGFEPKSRRRCGRRTELWRCTSASPRGGSGPTPTSRERTPSRCSATASVHGRHRRAAAGSRGRNGRQEEAALNRRRVSFLALVAALAIVAGSAAVFGRIANSGCSADHLPDKIGSIRGPTPSWRRSIRCRCSPASVRAFRIRSGTAGRRNLSLAVRRAHAHLA